jgi:hemin uptake protein HemP
MMTKPEAPDRPGDRAAEVKKTPSNVLSVRSEQLLRGARELQILHGGEIYRLLVTRNNKLILQK